MIGYCELCNNRYNMDHESNFCICPNCKELLK